jgi:plastocyanin
MRMRKRYVPLAAVLGVAAVVLPAVASSEATPTVSAVEVGSYGYGGFAWSPSQLEVGAGETVAFQNTSATVEHGVVWTAGPETPNCPGVPIGEGKTSWKGTCTFAHAGVYSFHCFVHPTEMKGTITVSADGTVTTTTTTTPTTPTTTAPTSTTPTESHSGSPLLGSPSLRSSQRGDAIKGSLDISKAGVGDRLEVDVLARTASLAKAKRPASTRVGRFVRGSVSAGSVSFAVSLDAKARAALKRHRRLGLTVKITLTPFYGEALTITRAVVAHA